MPDEAWAAAAVALAGRPTATAPPIRGAAAGGSTRRPPSGSRPTAPTDRPSPARRRGPSPSRSSSSATRSTSTSAVERRVPGRAAAGRRPGCPRGGLPWPAGPWSSSRRCPASVLAVHVAVGEAVEAGEPIVTLEAMKMEHGVVAPGAGRVAEVRIAAGDQVDPRAGARRRRGLTAALRSRSKRGVNEPNGQVAQGQGREAPRRRHTPAKVTQRAEAARNARGAARAPPQTRAPERGAARQRGVRAAVDQIGRIEVRIAADRTGDGPAPRLIAVTDDPRRVRIYEVGPRDGLQNEATPIPTAPSSASSSSSPTPACARSRRRLRRPGRDPAAGRRRRADGRPPPPRRRPLPGPRPEPARPGSGGGRRRRRDRRLHRRDRRVHDPQHPDDRRRVARGVRAGPRAAPASSAGGGAATSRPRSAARTPAPSSPRAPSRSRSGCSSSASTRSASATRSGSASRPGRELTGRAATPGSRSSGSRTTSTTRAARPSPTSRPRCCRASAASTADRRDRRLPVRAGRRRQPRHRGPRVPPRRDRARAWRGARRRPGGGPVHRRRARPAARDEGRPGRRLGPGDRRRGRPRADGPARRRSRHESRRSWYRAPTMNGVVLVLNQNYEPLNVCNLPRAFRLVFGEKAEVIEYDHQIIRTPRAEYHAPSVIRLQYQVRRPRPRVKLSRREIFSRDRHTCQYCGRQSHDLTLDHIVPRHRGGGHTWENLVTACKACNHRKGGKTLEEARFRLHATAVRAAQRHLLDVHAVPRRRATTRRGGRTCSWAGTEPTDGDAPDGMAADPGSPSTRSSRLLWAAGHAAYVVGGALRDALLGRRRADWDLATAALPERDAGSSSRTPSTRTRSGRWPSAPAARVPDHHVPDRPRLRRLPAAAPGRVRRRRSRPTSPGATSR